jgi:hypothetical protein
MFKSHKVYISGWGYGTAHWSADDFRTTLCGRRFEGRHQMPDDCRMCRNCLRIMAKVVAVAHVYALADNTNRELERAAAEAHTSALEVNSKWDAIVHLEGKNTTNHARLLTAAEMRAELVNAGHPEPVRPTLIAQVVEAPKAVTPTTARRISQLLRTKGFNPTYTAKRGSWSGLRVSKSGDEVRVRVWSDINPSEPSDDDRATAKEIAELLVKAGYVIRYQGDSRENAHALYVRGREITP